MKHQICFMDYKSHYNINKEPNFSREQINSQARFEEE